MKKKKNAKINQQLFPIPSADCLVLKMSRFQFITKSVLILSLVSFFTDVSSEMLYPIMPIYLKSIGFSVVLIGILEGIAEASAGLSKMYFGRLSDISGKRLPFVRLGYFLSAISKPLMSIFEFPMWIFSARTMDRLGKGIRTSARDALLSSESTKENKGKVFGFHRGMDTLGAVLGPLLALLYLQYFPEDYKTLFIIAFVPGIISVLFTFIVKEKNIPQKTSINPTESLWKYLKQSPTKYKRLVFGLLLFTLINSSDMFLLLKMKETGLEDSNVIFIYIFYNLTYAIFSYPMGSIGDKIGLKHAYILGLTLFGIVYIGMGIGGNLYYCLTLFFLYGIYSASAEGISKAWITNICDSGTATAIGTYSGLNSVFAMISSSIAGLIWFSFSSKILFYGTGLCAIIIILYFTKLDND